MKLIINGKEKELKCSKVSDLLSDLGLDKDTVAVELNKNIVHRQDFDNTKLKDNDKLEIVKVVGGG
jgi:sulfur carrier protein